MKYFADALWKVANGRNIDVNLKTNLVRVDGSKNEATFANVDNPDDQTTVEVLNNRTKNVSLDQEKNLICAQYSEIGQFSGFFLDLSSMPFCMQSHRKECHKS